MTAKPAVDEVIDSGKQKLTVMLTVEVFGEPAKLLCDTHGLLLFGEARNFKRKKGITQQSHEK